MSLPDQYMRDDITGLSERIERSRLPQWLLRTDAGSRLTRSDEHP